MLAMTQAKTKAPILHNKKRLSSPILLIISIETPLCCLFQVKQERSLALSLFNKEKRERQTERERERERDRAREKERQSERERETERVREKER